MQGILRFNNLKVMNEGLSTIHIIQSTSTALVLTILEAFQLMSRQYMKVKTPIVHRISNEV